MIESRSDVEPVLKIAVNARKLLGYSAEPLAAVRHHPTQDCSPTFLAGIHKMPLPTVGVRGKQQYVFAENSANLC